MALLAQAGFPDWRWLGNPRTHERLRDMLVEHVELTILAVVIGLAIAGPLGIAAVRWRRLVTPMLSVTGILFTIPSLALFILVLSVFDTGLSRTTALIGLVTYSLLILFRNTVAGFDSVPADVREAGEAMGHTWWQLLWRVQLPVALPVIVAGIRVATVSTIGLVTITALIGQGGFGRLFITGFARQNATILLTGIVCSALLAVVLDLVIVLLQRQALPWARSR